jgi:heme/copper-type cytochrome/quinol oxidase subunit 2
VRSPAARIAIGLAALAAVVVLFIVFTGGDDDNDNKASTTTTQAAQGGTTTTQTQTVEATPQITIRGGKPVGGIKKLDYNKGDQVKFIVTSDVADEIHVHGYDLKEDVPAGGSVRFSFPASIEGVFEVELEGRTQQIAQLKVEP